MRGCGPLGLHLWIILLRRLVENPLFFNYSLETIYKILMILIAVKHVESGKDKFIFLLNQFLEQSNIIWVRKVISSERIDIGEQL